MSFFEKAFPRIHVSSFVLTVIAVSIFLLGSGLILASIEEWTLGKALYFGIVTLTTVGYGDITPTKDVTRLITAFYTISSITLIWTTLSYYITEISRRIKQSARKELLKRLRDSDRVGIFDQRHVNWLRYIEALGIFTGFVCVATVVASLTVAKSRREKLAEGGEEALAGNDWVTGFYFTIVTISTVGYGDVHPETTFEKCVMLIIMILGIPLFGGLLSKFTDVIFSPEVPEMRTVVGGLTTEKLGALTKFKAELDCTSKEHAGINEYEFLAFLLIANDVMSLDDVHDLMVPFYVSDISQKGFLDDTDVREVV